MKITYENKETQNCINLNYLKMLSNGKHFNNDITKKVSLTQNNNMAKIELIILKNNIKNGNYLNDLSSREYENILINKYSSYTEGYIMEREYYEIIEKHEEIKTVYTQEISWLVNKLYLIFKKSINNNKTNFCGIFSQKAINYLEMYGDPKTPEPLLLYILEGAYIWIKKINYPILSK